MTAPVGTGRTFASVVTQGKGRAALDKRGQVKRNADVKWKNARQGGLGSPSLQATSSPLFFAEQSVDAKVAAAGRREEEEDKGVNGRELAPIQQGPEALGGMGHEVGDRH